jgi:hypothetical protein
MSGRRRRRRRPRARARLPGALEQGGHDLGVVAVLPAHARQEGHAKVAGHALGLPQPPLRGVHHVRRAVGARRQRGGAELRLRHRGDAGTQVAQQPLARHDARRLQRPAAALELGQQPAHGLGQPLHRRRANGRRAADGGPRWAGQEGRVPGDDAGGASPSAADQRAGRSALGRGTQRAGWCAATESWAALGGRTPTGA